MTSPRLLAAKICRMNVDLRMIPLETIEHALLYIKHAYASIDSKEIDVRNHEDEKVISITRKGKKAVPLDSDLISRIVSARVYKYGKRASFSEMNANEQRQAFMILLEALRVLSAAVSERIENHDGYNVVPFAKKGEKS